MDKKEKIRNRGNEEREGVGSMENATKIKREEKKNMKKEEKILKARKKNRRTDRDEKKKTI